jgi:hypothetical protein
MGHGAASFVNYWIVGLLVAIYVIAVAFSKRPRRIRYFSRKSLHSPAELRFAEALEQAIPKGMKLCHKPRLGDLLSCDSAGMKRGDHNKVNCKHVDFLLVSADDYSFQLAIELDDRSHEKRKTRQRDAFVDAALDSAGIPILHVRCSARYDVQELAEDIRSVLEEHRALGKQARRKWIPGARKPRAS